MSDDDDVPLGWVLAGVDGSESDSRVVDWAAGESERRSSGLCVFFAVPPFTGAALYDVMPPELLLESGKPIAQEAVNRVRLEHPDLAVTSLVLLEDPASALVRLSARTAALVVGARGLGWISGRFLGSVSQRVVAHARCPVVVVHDLAAVPDGPVVVGVDSDHIAPEVLQFAFTEAERRGVGLRVVFATARGGSHPVAGDGPAGVIHNSIDEASALEVQTVAEQWSEHYPAVPVDIRVVRRHPVEALTMLGATACLVVVGHRVRGRLAELHLGSVTRGVLHELPVVAVVPVGPNPVRHRASGHAVERDMQRARSGG
jgi:nucleotide-binding universal stress UspA family protein